MHEDLNLVVTTPDHLKLAYEYLSDLGNHPRLAIDTETCGARGVDLEVKPALRQNSVMIGLSISKNRDSGVYFPWYKSPGKASIWPRETLIQMRQFLATLFRRDDIGWVLHHAIFDILVLKRHIARPKNVVFDTQIAAHELDENRSIRLKDLGEAMYGIDAKAEKQAMMAWAHDHPAVFGSSKPSEESVMGQLWKMPIELVGKYCIQDTKLTKALHEDLGKQLMDQGLVKRYKWKNNLIPIYEEINSTGWPIDEEILLEAGSKMFGEISGLFKVMHESLTGIIEPLEESILEKLEPIAATPTWKKRIAEREGLLDCFTVPAMKTVGRGAKATQIPHPDAGKIKLGKDYVDAFLNEPLHASSFTAEFLKWDGVDISALSPELTQELKTMQKELAIKARVANADAAEKVPCPYVFNFGSDQQLQRLLFEVLGLPISKTTKSGAPDVSEGVLVALADDIIRQAGLNPADKKDRAKYIAEGDRRQIVQFLEALLKFRELEKLYGTYVIGILKRLYTHQELKRKPEINPKTGHIVKYCISHVNMTGTVTGRPSSSEPNQLNFPKDGRIKDAFVAPEGYKIGSADYDSQEVREATNISLDKDMKDIFTVVCESCGAAQSETIRNRTSLDVYKTLQPEYTPQFNPDGTKKLDEKGKQITVMTRPPDPSICCPGCKAFNWSEPDPHSLTVRRVYPEARGMSLKEIKKTFKDTLRQAAKVVLFQTLYGGTGKALSESLKITVDEAKKIQEAFFEGAPKIKAAIDRIILEAKERGYVETIGGYRRHLPDLAIDKLPFMERPTLDDEVVAWRCFGQVDFYPEVDANGKAKKMSRTECPRSFGDLKCPFKKQCSYAFRRSQASKLKARAERQAFNVQIQGNSADVTNTALMNICAKRAELAKINPAWNRVKIISNIYDAIYLLVPDELCPTDPINDPEEVNYLKVLKWAMENTYSNMFVPLTAGLEAPASSWGECH